MPSANVNCCDAVAQRFFCSAKLEQEQLGGEQEKKKRKVRIPPMADYRRRGEILILKILAFVFARPLL